MSVETPFPKRVLCTGTGIRADIRAHSSTYNSGPTRPISRLSSACPRFVWYCILPSGSLWLRKSWVPTVVLSLHPFSCYLQLLPAWVLWCHQNMDNILTSQLSRYSMTPFPQFFPLPILFLSTQTVCSLSPSLPTLPLLLPVLLLPLSFH